MTSLWFTQIFVELKFIPTSECQALHPKGSTVATSLACCFEILELWMKGDTKYQTTTIPWSKLPRNPEWKKPCGRHLQPLISVANKCLGLFWGHRFVDNIFTNVASQTKVKTISLAPTKLNKKNRCEMLNPPFHCSYSHTVHTRYNCHSYFESRCSSPSKLARESLNQSGQGQNIGHLHWEVEQKRLIWKETTWKQQDWVAKQTKQMSNKLQILVETSLNMNTMYVYIHTVLALVCVYYI